jgi:RNA-directed DNA polymerase
MQEVYWKRRMQQTAKESLEPKFHRLAYQQRYCCPACGDSLANGEVIERHHLILDKAHPTRNDPSNMRLVHLFCHNQIHSGKCPTMTRKLIREA